MIHLWNNPIKIFYNPEIKAIMFKLKLTCYFIFKILKCPPSHTEKVLKLLQSSEGHTQPEHQHVFPCPHSLFFSHSCLSQYFRQAVHAPVSELLCLPITILPSNITKIKVAMFFPIPHHNCTISRAFWKHLFKKNFH